MRFGKFTHVVPPKVPTYAHVCTTPFREYTFTLKRIGRGSKWKCRCGVEWIVAETRAGIPVLWFKAESHAGMEVERSVSER